MRDDTVHGQNQFPWVRAMRGKKRQRPVEPRPPNAPERPVEPYIPDDKPEGWGWSKHMTADGRVFLPKGDGFVMAKIDTDEYGFAVRYVRGDDGGFRRE